MATRVTSGGLVSYDFCVPKAGDRVYKDECIYCFDTPISDGGLYVCLSTLLGVCSNHLEMHTERRKKTVYLHLKKIPKESASAKDGSPPEKKPTKLAIGVEGGFDVNQDKIEYEDLNCLIITDSHGSVMEQYLLPDANLPLNAQLAIAAVIAHQGALLQDEVQAWEEKRNVSRHADNLLQLDNGVKIPPTGWKCSLCDLTENLWLNLTDGTILCGRKYFDGSGGNNHAVEYYQRTKYPLAVKLGTINGEGGDVYSYDEDDMVEDPKLADHLKHFGINIALLEKTDKTMTELEIEANLSLKAEWDTLQEAGEKLTPLYGCGYTGMINLGNSCYFNSLMQTLFSIEEFQRLCSCYAEEILQRSVVDPPLDFNVQMCKLASGLLSGLYSKEPAEKAEPLGVKPQMLKHLIDLGHAEFSTNHQQDVEEYFLHLMDVIDKNEINPSMRMKDLFRFEFEDKIECLSSHKVCYKEREDIVWALPIPLDAAINKREYDEFKARRAEAESMKSKIDPQSVVRLKIPMEACIQRFASANNIEDFYSSAIKGKTTAQKMTRFSTFPDYLVIQLKKFTIGEDWTPKKLDVSVDMLDVIDLSQYRGKGLQPNEEELPSDDGQPPISSEPIINEESVAMLMDMGFPLEACKKAVYYTNNQGVEAAMNWVFEHSQDPDFDMPLQLDNTGQPSKCDINPDPSSVAMIVSMGFTESQAKAALKKTKNNIEHATEWIFNHLDELNAIEVDECVEGSCSESKRKFRDGEGKYRLFAFISHMGTSTSCGHYVCHIFKDDRWVIYNDRKVAVSVNPPKDLGYLYFYRRVNK